MDGIIYDKFGRGVPVMPSNLLERIGAVEAEVLAIRAELAALKLSNAAPAHAPAGPKPK